MYKQPKYTQNKEDSVNNIPRLYGVPPQDTALEEAILGAVLLEEQAFDKAILLLPNPNIFYKHAHSKIWECIISMQKRGINIDLLTVTAEIRKYDKITQDMFVGGIAYFLTVLTTSVLSSAHIEAHCRKIYEYYIKREMIRSCHDIIGKCYNDNESCFEILDELELSARNIIENIPQEGGITLGKSVEKVVKEIKILKETGNRLIGITSGYNELDNMTHGWGKADLIIIAARPSIGKSAFVLNLLLNAAVREQCESLLFSLEMGEASLTKRFMAIKLGISLERLKNGNISDFEENHINAEIATFHKLPIKIFEKVFGLNHICNVVRKYIKVNKGLRLVAIDYLQLISHVVYGGTRENAVSEISRTLKLLAKELDISIIALSQLNRQVEQTANKKPKLSDLRESGAIEQDADFIGFLYHDNEQKTYLSVQKYREGKTGDIEMSFNKEIQLWEQADDIRFRDNKPNLLQAKNTEYNPFDTNNDDLPF